MKVSVIKFGFDKDVWRFVVPVLALAGTFFAVGWRTAGVIALLLGLFVLFFFRDPPRQANCAENAILSPADGKVVGIEIVEEPEYLGGRAKRVSIFLSIFDVHINYSPISGTVEFMKYKRGRFVTAANARSSVVNAQNAVGICNDSIKILVKQIAGIIARRIVCRLRLNDNIRRGQKFGMIRFGSRAEVYLPPECEVAVKLGQNVVGGTTPLALYHQPLNKENQER